MLDIFTFENLHFDLQREFYFYIDMEKSDASGNPQPKFENLISGMKRVCPQWGIINPDLIHLEELCVLER